MVIRVQLRTDTEKGNIMSEYKRRDEAKQLSLDGQELLDYYLDDDFWDVAYRADLKKENPEEYEKYGVPLHWEETTKAEKQSNLNMGEFPSCVVTGPREFFEETVAKDPRINGLDCHHFDGFSTCTFFYKPLTTNIEELKEYFDWGGMQYKFDIYPYEGCTSYTVTRWFTEAN